MKENRNQNTPEQIRVIVRNLPESDGQNTLNKVNALIKDGLHLNDVKALTADRNKSYKEGKQGVIVVTLQSAGDKRKIMDKKRDFKDVFIENDVSKNQHMLNMNLRNIVNAIGDNKLEIRGGRIQPRG